MTVLGLLFQEDGDNYDTSTCEASAVVPLTKLAREFARIPVKCEAMAAQGRVSTVSGGHAVSGALKRAEADGEGEVAQTIESPCAGEAAPPARESSWSSRWSSEDDEELSCLLEAGGGGSNFSAVDAILARARGTTPRAASALSPASPTRTRPAAVATGVQATACWSAAAAVAAEGRELNEAQVQCSEALRMQDKWKAIKGALQRVLLVVTVHFRAHLLGVRVPAPC